MLFSLGRYGDISFSPKIFVTFIRGNITVKIVGNDLFGRKFGVRLNFRDLWLVTLVSVEYTRTDQTETNICSFLLQNTMF